MHNQTTLRNPFCAMGWFKGLHGRALSLEGQRGDDPNAPTDVETREKGDVLTLLSLQQNSCKLQPSQAAM